MTRETDPPRETARSGVLSPIRGAGKRRHVITTLLLLSDPQFIMGFGSYDESEQESQTPNDEDEGEGVNVHENNHQGEVTFESDASADELLDQLEEMKSDASED